MTFKNLTLPTVFPCVLNELTDHTILFNFKAVWFIVSQVEIVKVILKGSELHDAESRKDPN